MIEAAARSHGRIPTRESRPLAGIACLLAGVALLTLSDAAAEWFTADYPVGEVVSIPAMFIFYRERRLGPIYKAPQSV